MTALSRLEFNSFIATTLPDNSSREISASDLRQSFFNLADSIANFNKNINLNSKNIGELSSSTVYAGTSTFSRKGVNGFSTSENTAIGYSSLELSYTTKGNTALGAHTLSCLSLGNDNAALGVNALGGLTTGSGNVGLGNYTLLKNKTGNFNIAIGYGAGYLSGRNEDFKFYVGSYPDASGDCDTTLDSINKSPLLYGDLKTLQLAIGASGFRGDEKLSVSGNILPYESGVGFSLGSGEYRWDIYAQDLYISGNITSSQEFYNIYFSDGATASDLIGNGETVFISGVSGIGSSYDASSNLISISAHPISGYLNQEINLLSGLAPAFGGTGGLIWNVSGWAKQYADGVGISAGAYTHWNIRDESDVGENITDPSTANNTVRFHGATGIQTSYDAALNRMYINASPLSGVLKSFINTTSGNLFDTINASGASVSGWASKTIANTGSLLNGRILNTGTALINKIDASGSAISGWADYNIFNENGYLGLVSGWATNTFAISTPGGSYTHWVISDEDSNSSNIIQGYGDVVFGGISGIKTIWDGTNLNISAQPISGWAEYEINEITKTNGVIDQKLAPYTLTSVLNALSNSIYGGGSISAAQSLSGILNQTTINSGNQVLSVMNSSGNAISGFADYNIFNPDGYVGLVSGYNVSYTDSEISKLVLEIDSDAYLHWKLKDSLGNGVNVAGQNVVTFNGNKGISTSYSTAGINHGITISAEGISGWARHTIASSGASVSGWAQKTINASGQRLVNLYSAKVDASGAAISGWANYNIFDPNGYVGLVSGWATETFNVATPGGSYTHWTISDGVNTDNILQGDPDVIFGGISGIKTNYRSDTGTLEISAHPLSGWVKGYVNGDFYDSVKANPELNGELDRVELYASGLAVSGYARETIWNSGNKAYQDALYQTNLISGWQPGYLVYNVSGYLQDALSTSAGSGLVKLNNGEFNTAGTGNFDNIILNKFNSSSGQIVANSGSYHDIVNTSGYLVLPTYEEFEDLKTLSRISANAGNGVAAFAGGHLRVSDGSSWSRPPVVEGFMFEDLDAPSDYSTPTSGRIVTRNENFQASDIYYVTNRDHTFAASGGYFLMAMLVNNEYRPVWSTCSGCNS